MQFPYIRIEGDRRTRGLQYGRAAGDIIRRGLDVYRPSMETAKIGQEEFNSRCDAFISTMDKFAPELLLELRAVSDGAELPLNDLLLISGRTELLYGGAVAQPEDGCTAAVALPTATGGSVIHGQNWDWRDECVHSTIVLHVVPDDGPEIITLVEAGGLARCGLNSAGIAITGNFLKCERDDGVGGVPLALLRRKVLDCSHYADGLGILVRTPISFSNNILISSASGHAVNFEKVPGDIFWIMDEGDGLIVHSNHFLAPSARARVSDLGIAVSPDTLYRDRRVREILQSASSSRVTEATFREALADRFEWPQSVCRPPLDGGVGGAKVSTVATVIMNVTEGTFNVRCAPYTDGDFQTYQLENGPNR